MKETTLEDFIDSHATERNSCFYYEEYSQEIQESLKNIYMVCFRIGLYKSQTLYMLDEALKPFEKETDLFEMLEG